MMQGDSFPSEPSGIMEVAMWLCAPLRVGLWYSLGLVHNYVVLIFGNERWGSSSYARSSYTWIGLRKLVVLTSNIHQTFNGG